MVVFPIDIIVGPARISSHLILYLLAFFLAFQYYLYLRNDRRDFITEENRWFIIIGATIGALFGSRLLAALEVPSLFFNPPSFLYYLLSQTIVGGLLGGYIGVELVKLIISEKRNTGDLFTYPIILGMIIGRTGCFLTGVSDRTVGIASEFIFAIDQGDGILRHPTSLYEIIFLLLLWVFLLLVQKNYNLKNGNLFKLFMIFYLMFRFVIEFIKPVIPLILGLSGIQIASLIGVVFITSVLLKKGIIKNG